MPMVEHRQNINPIALYIKTPASSGRGGSSVSKIVVRELKIQTTVREISIRDLRFAADEGKAYVRSLQQHHKMTKR